jgi:hypothetical protein
MKTIEKLARSAMLPAIAGVMLAGCSAVAGSDTANAEPLRCEIAATASGGSTRLEAIAHADTPMSGHYSFRVASSGRSGSSTIQQGGEFDAGPGRSSTLGVSSFGGSYDARLELVANGRNVSCHRKG